MSNYRDAGPACPVLLATTEEFLSLATGYRCPPPPPPGWADGWKGSLVRLKWGQRPRGRAGCAPKDARGWRESTGAEFRELERLAGIGGMLDEAGVKLRVAPGPLPPLADRLAALEGHAREYARSRRRRRPADPKQRTLFAGGEA